MLTDRIIGRVGADILEKRVSSSGQPGDSGALFRLDKLSSSQIAAVARAILARCVTASQPAWWLMENVPGVPSLAIHGYHVQRFNVAAAEFGCSQRRLRTFQFGSRDGQTITLMRTVSHYGRGLKPAVLAHDGRRNFAELCELQGLPRDFNLLRFAQEIPSGPNSKTNHNDCSQGPQQRNADDCG